MRVRTERKRREILESARRAFRTHGYRGASMSAIAAEIGGSKGTLYGYFPSKEALFAALSIEIMEERGQAVMGLLDRDDPDIRAVLRRFAAAFLDLVATPDAAEMTRRMIGSTNPAIPAASLYARGPKRGWEDVADYLRALQERGILRAADPKTAALHLKGLLEAGSVEPMLYGAPREIPATAAIETAVDVFLRAYAA